MVTRIYNEQPIVALVVEDRAKRHLAGERVMDFRTFEQMAPHILAETHSKNIIKWDYQDQLGKRRLGIRYSFSERTLICIEAGIEKVPLQQFLGDSTLQNLLRNKCAEIGVDFNLIFGELQYLPQN